MPKGPHESYKYNRLIGILRQKIFAGEFSPSGKLPPERKLAELFGFSRITIRTALQELREDGLIEQRQGQGTFVAGFAKPAETVRDPEPGRERRFCFVCNESPMELPVEDDPFNSQLLLGFFRARTGGRNFKFDTCSVTRGIPLEEQMVRRGIDLAAWDGVVIASPLQECDLDYLFRNRVRFVLQGEPVSQRYFPVVTVDNFRGAWDATTHLIENGRSRPLFLDGDFGLPWGERRAAGFRQALAAEGLECAPEQLVPLKGRTREEAKAQFTELLAGGIRFDSVVVLGDWPTVGVVDALKEAKLRIPEDVAVLNYDGYTWLFNSVTPALTHVTQPFARIGECCVEMLYELIRNSDAEVSIRVIPPTLVVRESTVGKKQ